MAEPSPTRTWIEAARRGDRSAASKLLAVYHPLLRTRVEARLDPALRARYEPEDILQQVYLQVSREIIRLEGDTAEAFLNWVLTVVDHKLVDAWRAAHRQARDLNLEKPAIGGANADSYWNLLEQLHAESGTPSRAVRRDEALEALAVCIQGLSESHRRVIQLRFLEGLPVSEVAARLHATQPAVVALTKRALDALHRAMDRLGEFTHGG